MTVLNACVGRIATVCKTALMFAINRDWMSWKAADRLMAAWPRLKRA